MENNTNNETEKNINDSSNQEVNLKEEKEIKIEDNNKKEDEIKNDKEQNENQIKNSNEIEQKDEDKQVINEQKEEIKEEIKEEKKEEIKKEEKNGEEEEMTTNEYVIRCDKCLLVPVIKLDHSTFKIHCQCENNHIKSNILISQALKESKNISTKICSSCNEKSEEDNYFCLQCQKIFCLDNGCKKKHSKEQPNHKLININNLDNSCLDHSTSFSKYCKDCKKNICVKCQREIHSNHKLIDLGEILPLDEEIEKAKKLFEEKEKKLLNVKKSITDWLDELNIKINALLDSIEGEILINKNILKCFKTDLMNYQMIENFNYFSNAESVNFYTNKELIDLVREKSWIHKTFLITQILNNLEKPMQVSEEKDEEINVEKEEDKKVENAEKKEEKKSNLKHNNKNHKVTIIDDNNNNNNANNAKKNILSKSTTIVLKNKEKGIDNLNLNKISHSSKIKVAKTFSVSQLFLNDHYKSLTEITNINVSKKVFKSNVNIKENIYSALIDNKGVIFLGGESCLSIYRLDLKSNKIENEFSIKLDGKINTIAEIKDNYLIIGSSTGTIRIIEFLGNKKHHIHQEIRNQDRNSIYKIIELSNYDLVSCDERNIILYHSKKNFYDLSQEINLNSPTCCVLQISKNIIAATHVVLQTISFYEISKGKLSLKKEIEKIDSTVNNTSMAIINEDYFCSVSQKLLYIFNIDKLELSKKIELQMSTSILFPISYDKLLFCHEKENEKGKVDTSLSLKTFDADNITLNDAEQNIVSKNKDKEAEDNIYYVNFFEHNTMILISKNNISYWG